MSRAATAPAISRRSQGFTLIELMVSLAVASLISLAVMGTLSVAASSRRNTHAANDINQSGAYAITVLDRLVRSAGAGFAQTGSHALGCALQASKSSTQILPLPSATNLPDPFATLSGNLGGVFRLAPVVIADGATSPNESGGTSDALIVMAGHSGQAESALNFTALGSTTSLPLKSALGVGRGSLLLLGDRQPGASGVKPCMLTQVSSSWTVGSLPIGLNGTHYASTINTYTLTDYSLDAFALNLGNTTDNNPPRFQVLGVGDAGTLYAYDLLKTDSTPLQPLAAGLFELHALYGVDSNGDGLADTWVSPSATGYTATTLLDGSAASATKLGRIKALRVGLILRTNITADQAGNSAASVTLFSDLGTSLTYTRSLSTAERAYRYRTAEATIPLRNTMMVD